MHELDIELICANSPQAKGKVERANQTLQDRLIKELRLRGISTIEEANRFLPEFIEKYNEKFAKLPKSKDDAHRDLTMTQEQLNYILSVRQTRKLCKNLECCFYNITFQIQTKTHGRRLQHAEVQIAEDTNGNITVWYNNQLLEFKIINKNLKTKVVERKNIKIGHQFKRGKPTKPAHNHPWRRYNKTLRVSLQKQELSNLARIGSF